MLPASTIALLAGIVAPLWARDPVDIGSRRELFVDHCLVDTLEGAELAMGRPRDEGIVLTLDKPWEGRYSGYGVVMKAADGDYRYYYRGSPVLVPSQEEVEVQTCLAVSQDGIHWERPDLRLYDVHGTPSNNVCFKRRFYSHNFAPFLDKPGAPPGERFKAIAGIGGQFGGGGLAIFASGDGIHWNPKFDGRTVIRGRHFDAMNRVFWSASEQCYVFYGRVWKGNWRWRWIGRATSTDLEHWTAVEPVRILHQGRDVPLEHYYHNGTTPYFRAPHIYIALVSHLADHGVLTDDQVASLDLETAEKATARSGAGLMSSRGGNTFQKTFMEEFIRPGIGAENWVARCKYPSLGVVQTGPAEMSFYVDEYAAQPHRAQRRYSLRLDGFASLRAPFSGGEAVTRPFTFRGDKLSINYSTASRGSIRMQLETPDGDPIEGFTLADCREIIGDEIHRTVRFKSSAGVGGLAGRPVRLRIVMKDADLYSFQFQP